MKGELLAHVIARMGVDVINRYPAGRGGATGLASKGACVVMVRSQRLRGNLFRLRDEIMPVSELVA